MRSPFQYYTVIRNNPKNYPFYKKFVNNTVFLFLATVINPRDNLLSKEDIYHMTHDLKKGDVLVVGNLRTIFGKINSPFTHVLMYIGHGKFICATPEYGVIYEPLKKIFREYDTAVIMRIPNKKIISRAVKYLKKQIGKPYNYDLLNDQSEFFCSELINDAFLESGYNTKLKNNKKKVKGKIRKILTYLKPVDFIKSNLNIIFLSHNLELKKKKVILKKN